ncbi:MAG: hypothetical protein ACRDY0_05420 [Acidimicrobiales bacterium]
MTDAHKAAMARGRGEGRAVRLYLETLERQRANPRRRRSPAHLARQLDQTGTALETAAPLERLHLTQRRIDLEKELAEALAMLAGDPRSRESEFVIAAPGYSKRKRISYQAWRQMGVPARVLRAAGIKRTSP